MSKSGYNDGSSTSDRSALVVKGPITTNTAVSINGTPTVGTASTLTAGSYTPAPTGTSYQWRLCDSSGASCADIGGATSSTYTPVAGDVGGTLRVVETVTKAGYSDGGSTSAASPVVVNGSIATNTAVAVNGTPMVDAASTLTAGSYTPTPSSSSYQWRLCNGSGTSCADIGGATSSTYTPVAGDVGGTLRVVETVSKAGYNNGGSTSAASPVVVNASFSTTTAVAINGTPTARHGDDDHERRLFAVAHLEVVSVAALRQLGCELRGHRWRDEQHVHAALRSGRLDVAGRGDGVEGGLQQRQLDLERGRGQRHLRRRPRRWRSTGRRRSVPPPR